MRAKGQNQPLDNLRGSTKCSVQAINPAHRQLPRLGWTSNRSSWPTRRTHQLRTPTGDPGRFRPRKDPEQLSETCGAIVIQISRSRAWCE
jgi:hypothetical protein